MKTAVEWLQQEVILQTNLPLNLENVLVFNKLIKQAKEMEKEQIIDFAKKFSDFNGLTFNEKEVSKEYLEKLYSNQKQMKIIKTKKCDWCNKRKNIDNGYYIGKLESSKTDKEFFICVDCNLKHNIV
jgi:hypothetical protein